jgi:hypothetical protein
VPDGPTSDSARRKKGRGAAVAHKRLCAECGFADQTDREALERYMGYVPSTEAVVDGDLWLWCRICRKVKRGDEAESEGQCRDKCAACFVRIGCRHKVTCGLVVEAEVELPIPPTWRGFCDGYTQDEYSLGEEGVYWDSDGGDSF